MSPFGPCDPVAPFKLLNLKLNTLLVLAPVAVIVTLGVPTFPAVELSTVGVPNPAAAPAGPVAPVAPSLPAGPVAPVSPLGPCAPVFPVAPVAPLGIPKVNLLVEAS